MSTTLATDPVKDYLTPILIYIGGRLLEAFLKFIYSKWKGIISFQQEIVNDIGFTTIRSKTDVFFDEAIIHLPEGSIDILQIIKSKLELADEDRVQLGSSDKIRIECIIQRGGDKKIVIHALIGKKVLTSSENIDSNYETPKDFMNHAELTIDKPSKRYKRKLYINYY